MFDFNISWVMKVLYFKLFLLKNLKAGIPSLPKILFKSYFFPKLLSLCLKFFPFFEIISHDFILCIISRVLSAAVGPTLSVQKVLLINVDCA